MNYEVNLVPTKYVYYAWQQVRHMLEPAIERTHGRWRPEYVFAALVNGQQGLWVVHTDDGPVGAATTEIVRYPERKMVAVHYLGGSGFDDWYADLLAAITVFGRENGCDGIELNARPGFWKWLKEDGFQRTSVNYERKI